MAYLPDDDVINMHDFSIDKHIFSLDDRYRNRRIVF